MSDLRQKFLTDVVSVRLVREAPPFVHSACQKARGRCQASWR